MADDFMKTYLHDYLRDVRQSMLAKVDGLSEYQARRPLTMTGTNLLGLIKHLAIWEARYFGLVFDRPLSRAPAPLGRRVRAPRHHVGHRARVPRGRHRPVPQSVATQRRHDRGPCPRCPGHVEWWPDLEVRLFDVLVHMLAETSRHAGHADIIREEIDGAVGPDAESMARYRKLHDAAFWEERRAEIELAARAAEPADV
jgi:hypothetical protein